MNIGINKKTGQIAAFEKGMIDIQELTGCKNVAEMLEAGWEWKYVPDEKWQSMLEELEDYEEHEYFWYISPTGTPIKSEVSIYDPLEIHLMKRIGNYFESEEDAEKAVEKCTAWTRLENKGFRFTGWATNEGIRGVDFEVPDSFFSEHNHSCISDETRKDLDLLFDDDDDDMPTNAEINDLSDMGYGR